jgi:DNA-binding transcriptional regulator/RsmH inhibitor MraZ
MQASLDHVEIWAKQQFENASKFDMKAMSALAEQVLGNLNEGGTTGGLS